MDDITTLLEAILRKLQEINEKLDEIRGTGATNLDDIKEKLDSLGGLAAMDMFGVFK